MESEETINHSNEQSNEEAMATTELPKEIIAAIEGFLGYRFRYPEYLWEALQARSARHGQRLLPDGNKRLALLGDKILGLVLIDVWYPTDRPRSKILYICSQKNTS